MDIIGFTETWLNPQIQNSLLEIENFNLIRNDRLYSRGGGTRLYVRHGISYAKNAEFSNKLVEMQSITLTGEREKQQLKPITVVLIYRPPRRQDRKCLDYILTYLSEITDSDKNELLIMGDLNWNLEEEGSLGLHLVNDIAETYGLAQHIEVSTRITTLYPG